MNAYVNLIPYNEVDEHGFRRSSNENVRIFCDYLKKKLNLDIDEYQYNLTDAYKELTKKLGENHE